MYEKTCNHFSKFSIHLCVRKSWENREIYGKSKASLWRNLSTGTPQNFFRTIHDRLRSVQEFGCPLLR